MVSIRCQIVVKAELTKIGLHFSNVELGHADIVGNISAGQFDQIRKALSTAGLELMDDQKRALVERIKNIVIEVVHHSEDPLPVNLSVYLSRQLNCNYTYLASVFSETERHTIERFYIEHKIELVKELLAYGELNLTQIAFRLHYSSVAHLSSQFKKITGNTASFYKKLNKNGRSMREEL